MRNWWIGLLLVAGLVGGVFIGVFIFGRNDVSEYNTVDTERLANFNDIKEKNIIINDIVETSSIENEKVSPNAIIIEKKYYKGCDHLIREVIDVPEKLVNKTEDEVKKEYDDWKLEGFSPNEIVVYKELTGLCGEHYLVKEHKGVIGIYTLDEYDKATLKEDTEILTQYLPTEDLEELKVGVKLVGKTSLYNFLENFE